MSISILLTTSSTDLLCGAGACDGVEVADGPCVVVTIVVGVVEVAAVVVGIAVEVEEEAASPTLGGPFVDPASAAAASRYTSPVTPVSPVMVKRLE